MTSINLILCITAFMFITEQAKSQSISELSLSSDFQATNSNVNIICSVQYPKSTDGTLTWRIDNKIVGSTTLSISPSSSPQLDSTNSVSTYTNRINVSNSDLTLVEETYQFLSILEIMNLTMDDNSINISASASLVLNAVTTTLRVQDCLSTLNYNVSVESNSSFYMDPGIFQCPDNHTLIYENGTVLTSPETECLATATWKGQQNLQCWSAPKVSINSSLSVMEGEDLVLMCAYDDTFPPGNSTIFYIGDEAVREEKNTPVIVPSLQVSNQGKLVSCQADTPYTQLFPDEGRSIDYPINVLYQPRNIMNEIMASQFVTKVDGGYLVSINRTFTMNCSSSANPLPKCRWMICTDQCATINNTNGNCLIDYALFDSSNVSCLVSNDAGSTKSSPQTFTVVPNNRPVRLSVTGDVSSMYVNDGGLSIRLGQNISLRCSVDYQNELNTMLVWILPNSTRSMQPSIDFESVSQSNTGNYTCITLDALGTFQSSIYVNVIYNAYQETPNVCIWNVNQAGRCEVNFLSNPQAEYIDLLKNGQPVINQGSNDFEYLEDTQIYNFERTKVSGSDAGTYSLVVRTADFPDERLITFDIEVSGTSNELLAPLIAVSCIAGCLLIAVVVVAIYFCVRKRKEEEADKANANINHVRMEDLTRPYLTVESVNNGYYPEINKETKPIPKKRRNSINAIEV